MKAEQMLDHLAVNEDRDGQDQGEPEAVAEHCLTVTGVFVVALVPGVGRDRRALVCLMVGAAVGLGVGLSRGVVSMRPMMPHVISVIV
ncbi:MAG: hypothetical protein BroJett011_13930 [Chloroflexota bacterium]|nr:MAG: hypothetical protein BroJett011_13930 [Chloroflexota bacterium]